MKRDLDDLPDLQVGDLVAPTGYWSRRRQADRGVPTLGIVLEVEDEEHIKVFWNDTKSWAWSHSRYLDIISCVDNDERE